MPRHGRAEVRGREIGVVVLWLAVEAIGGVDRDVSTSGHGHIDSIERLGAGEANALQSRLCRALSRQSLNRKQAQIRHARYFGPLRTYLLVITG